MIHNVLFIDHAKAVGGAEKHLLLLLEHLDRSKWTPHLGCSVGPLLERAEALDVSVHTLPMARLRHSWRWLLDWPRGAMALVRLARLIEADVLYANTVRAAIYAAPAAVVIRRPLIWHMQDFWLSEGPPNVAWADRLGKRVLHAAARSVLVNSDAVRATVPGSKVERIYCGLNQEGFGDHLNGSAFRRHYQIPESVPLIGMVGRLRPWKGQDRFLRIAALVLKEVPDAHFVIVGGSPFDVRDDYIQQISELARDLELSGRVCFTGQLENVAHSLSAMDVFVHPGDPEPFGLVNIEAMAMARPVVAFAHGALPEIVLKDQTGLLVPPFDEAAFAAAVVSLVRDPKRRATMGALGRVRIETCFSAERLVGEISAVLTRSLRAKR